MATGALESPSELAEKYDPALAWFDWWTKQRTRCRSTHRALRT